MTRYNGWKNYATWNIALWLRNDQGLYNMVRTFPLKYKSKAYRFFISYYNLGKERTKDNIYFLDKRLDYKALDCTIWEINKEG